MTEARYADDISATIDQVMQASRSFVYQCDNDDDVTMRRLLGSVKGITGCEPEQLIDSRERSYASLCHPEDVDVLVGQVDKAIDAHEPWDVDYRLIRPDGSIILVRERGEAVRADDGTVTFLHGLVIDSTAENALRTELKAKTTKVKTVNDEIMALAILITRSVKELKMLSVNARIEAARAGQAGLGFKIVADEINRLATSNANWAEEITSRMSR